MKRELTFCCCKNFEAIDFVGEKWTLLDSDSARLYNDNVQAYVVSLRAICESLGMVESFGLENRDFEISDKDCRMRGGDLVNNLICLGINAYKYLQYDKLWLDLFECNFVMESKFRINVAGGIGASQFFSVIVDGGEVYLFDGNKSGNRLEDLVIRCISQFNERDTNT